MFATKRIIRKRLPGSCLINLSKDKGWLLLLPGIFKNSASVTRVSQEAIELLSWQA